MATRHRWLTLVAALLGWAIDGVEMGVFPIIARPALIELLNTQDDELIRRWNGGLAIAFLLGAALGGYVFGRIGDRWGRVRALVLSMLTYSLLTGLAATVHSPIQLIVLRFLAATGMGGEWALGVALVVESWPNWARPWLAGAIGAAVNVGYIAVALAAFYFQASSWRLLLAWCAAPALLTFFIRWWVPESPRWQRVQKPPPSSWKKNAVIGALAVTPYLLAVWGAVQFTQLWVQHLTSKPETAASVQIVSAGAAILGAFLAPLLLFEFSRRWSYALLSATALVVSEWFFLTVGVMNDFVFAGVAAVGFVTGALGGWFALYLPELFPSAVRATGQGVSYNSGRILAAIGMALMTWTVDLRGQYVVASALISLIYVAGIALAWWLPETAGRSLE